jgi:hypothetical protein
VGRSAAIALWVLALVVVILVVDLFFFREHSWGRLIANFGIVVVFAALFYRFRPR